MAFPEPTSGLQVAGLHLFQALDHRREPLPRTVESATLRALEQALTQQRGECVAEVFEDSTGCRFPRWAPTVRQLPVPGTKLYTTPQPSADAVRELVLRWRDYGKDCGGSQVWGKCADELESLLGRGG